MLMHETNKTASNRYIIIKVIIKLVSSNKMYTLIRYEGVHNQMNFTYSYVKEKTKTYEIKFCHACAESLVFDSG